jgi:hypothetical protein
VIKVSGELLRTEPASPTGLRIVPKSRCTHSQETAVTEAVAIATVFAKIAQPAFNPLSPNASAAAMNAAAMAPAAVVVATICLDSDIAQMRAGVLANLEPPETKAGRTSSQLRLA